MVIGLGLAANAANNAMYNNNVYDFKYIAVALITLGLTIFTTCFQRLPRINSNSFGNCQWVPSRFSFRNY